MHAMKVQERLKGDTKMPLGKETKNNDRESRNQHIHTVSRQSKFSTIRDSVVGTTSAGFTEEDSSNLTTDADEQTVREALIFITLTL